MTRLLYTVQIKDASIVGDSGRATGRRQLAKLAALQGSGSVVPTGSEPNEVRLDGKITGKYADRLAREVIELLNASGFSELPFTNPTEDVPQEGYYVVERPTAGRVQPQSTAASTYDGTLVREGTRTSHRRQVRTTPTQTTHQWGTATDTPVGIPAAATKVEWVDADRTQEQTASADATLTAEHGDVGQYRADTAPYDNPRLVYDLPYNLEGNVDAAAFDTYGDSETDANGDFAWQQVFDAAHEYRGEIVLENGLIRLTIDESTDPVTLTAETWDSGTSAWTSTSLGTSDWALFDIDLRVIEPARVQARTKWGDTTSSSTHTLDLVLHRGWDVIQFQEPVDSDGNLLQSQQAPSGLVDLLDPIAASTRGDPEANQGLIARSDLPV